MDEILQRKFLVNRQPLTAIASPPHRIRQYYIASGRISLRIRDEGGQVTLTIRDGSGMVRESKSIAIDASAFDDLVYLAEGITIEKNRRVFEYQDKRARVDEFLGPLAGLSLLEVEFDDRKSANEFRPPPWAGIDVTNDGRYENQRLAADGRVPD